MTKTRNDSIKSYIENLAIAKFNSCKELVEAYGPNYAKDRLALNFSTAYSNETNPIAAGYFRFDNSITICNGDDELLTPEMINSDPNIQHTCFHEAIHAIFKRINPELLAHNISSGTGIHEYYQDGTEMGRGLNEGFTEWVCELCGMPSNSYYTEKNFVKMIEIAIGKEKLIQFGKGNISRNISPLLSLDEINTRILLAHADAYSSSNKNSRVYEVEVSNIESRLEICEALSIPPDSPDYPGEEKIEQLSDELRKSPLLKTVPYFVLSNLPPREQIYRLQTALILAKEEQEKFSKEAVHDKIRFENKAFTLLFAKEFQVIKEKGKLTPEEYEKYLKLRKLLGHRLPDKKSYDSVITDFLSDFEQLEQRYQQDFIESQISAKHLDSKAISDLIKLQKTYSLNIVTTGNSPILEEIGKHISPNHPKMFCAIENLLDKEDISRYSLLKVASVSKNGLHDINQTLVMKDGKVELAKGDYHTYSTSSEISASAPIFPNQRPFDFTLGMGENDQEIIRQFMDLKQQVESKNPNAKIQIFNRNIIINNNNNLDFYYIDNGNLIKLQPVAQIDLSDHFRAPQLTALSLQNKTSFLKNLWNRFKSQLLSKRTEHIVYSNDSSAADIRLNNQRSNFDNSLRNFEKTPTVQPIRDQDKQSYKNTDRTIDE